MARKTTASPRKNSRKAAPATVAETVAELLQTQADRPVSEEEKPLTIEVTWDMTEAAYNVLGTWDNIVQLGRASVDAVRGEGYVWSASEQAVLVCTPNVRDGKRLEPSLNVVTRRSDVENLQTFFVRPEDSQNQHPRQADLGKKLERQAMNSSLAVTKHVYLACAALGKKIRLIHPYDHSKTVDMPTYLAALANGIDHEAEWLSKAPPKDVKF